MPRRQRFMGHAAPATSVPLFPGVTCPPGMAPFNVGGKIVCGDPETFPESARYWGPRPIGAFGGFGMAPSAPIGTVGMGPSTLPVTMDGPAMLGQVRIVERPFMSRSRSIGQTLRCWATADGGTVCSDGLYYLPGCPKAPEVTESEILPTPAGAEAAYATGQSPVRV